MAEGSQLHIETTAGVTLVSFVTNNVLDVVQIQKIGEELCRMVDEPDRKKLVLDFSNVRMLSSQAIGMLLSVRKKSQAAKGEVVLSGLRPDLHKVFRITQIDKFFKFYDEAKQAVAAFGGQPQA